MGGLSLLVLGGTDFAGRAVAEAARDLGHHVSVLHRGTTPAPAGVTDLLGDRLTPAGLAALGRRHWDVVVDTWAGAPAVVLASAEHLAARTGRYVYISSRSVHTWPTPPGTDEAGAVVEARPEAPATDYSTDKRGAELAVIRHFGSRALLVRPGLLLGPGENVGRLPFWLRRIAHGGRVLAPGPPDTPLQYIDVRDLARWVLSDAAATMNGPVNVVSAPGHATIADVLGSCAKVTGSGAQLCWTSAATLAAAELRGWTDLPIWAPPGTAQHDALHRGDVRRALDAGLVCRPVAATVEDTWHWLVASGRLDEPSPCGYSAAQERRALALRDQSS